MNPTPDTSLARNTLSLLYDQYSSPLFGFIIRITGERELAESILQQTFLEIFTRIAEADHKKDNKLSWMLNIALINSLKCLPDPDCLQGDGQPADWMEDPNPERILKLIRQVMTDIHFNGITLKEAAIKKEMSLTLLIREMKKAVNLLPGGQVK